MTTAIISDKHPLDEIIRADRMPHIWCPGCGIGIAMRCYAQAILDSQVPVEKHVVMYLRYWLFGPGGWIYEHRLVSHHSWQGNSICRGDEAGKTRVDGDRLQWGW